MSHICPCTPCPSPPGYSSKVENRHFAHHWFEGCTGPSMSIIFFMKLSCFLCNIFPFPACKAQLIGEWYENRRGAPNPIIFLIIRQYYWRTEAPCANRNGGQNTKKNPRNIIAAPCLVRIAYWRRGTSLRQYIGAPIHPAPIVLAHYSPCFITNNRLKSVHLTKKLK
jgi:hypothetical protein